MNNDLLKKPNILFVFADQLSMLALDIYDSLNGARTPNINFLARNGVKFANSYCTAPQCSPSRSSMFAGLYPHNTGVIGNIGTPDTEKLDEENTLGSFLKKEEYKTPYIGKWHLGNQQESVEKHGFSKYFPEAISGGGEDTTKTYAALKFLEETQNEEQPWFLTVSYNQPHDIYYIKEMRDANRLDFNIDNIELPQNFIDDLSNKPLVQAQFRDKDQGQPLLEFKKSDWKYYIAYYNYLIEFLDNQLGRLIEKLMKTEQFDDTLIVFTSDHGDLMGSHRTPFKGPMMYDELLKVPLIFCWPQKLPKNEVRDQLTSNIDIFPTICELIDIDIPKKLDGLSLKECLLKNKQIARDFIIVQYYSKQKWINPIRTILNYKYKYNLYLSGEEELYDLKENQGEIDNLAQKQKYQVVKEELKQALLDWIKENNDPFFSYKNTDRKGRIK